MTAKRRKKSKRSSPRGIQVRRAADGRSYEFLFPPSVRERTEDMEEVRAMIEAGETEIAIDELRWLLGGCHELLEAHKLLGDLATGEGNRDLARAHYGYAFQLGTDAIPKCGLDHPLPHSNPANQAFHEAGAGLVRILLDLDERKKAAEVVRQLVALDPSDPLGVRELTKGP